MEMTINQLYSFDKILVYGAGRFGKKILLALNKNGINTSKLVVWDERGHEVGFVFGGTVAKPQFETFEDKNVPVIIAISPRKNAQLAEEIKAKFEKNGFSNIVTLVDALMPYRDNTMALDDFNKLVASGSTYDCEYQDDIDFSGFSSKVKTLAYYLPQFHEIAENEVWWGKGFTEWTNTKKSKPNFKGHYQPREPHEDFGYYDLTNVDVIRKQAKLARKHGIYGWCIYHYWFSGKRILERPVDIIYNNKDIDINYCFIWANETWTKAWVGNSQEVLIRQEYCEDDPERFIDDLAKYVEDPRYIRVNGKPMIVIFTPQDIPGLGLVVAKWRKRALEIGIGEIHIIVNSREYSPEELHIDKYIDGAAGFCHQYSILREICKSVINDTDEIEYGKIYDYSKYVEMYCDFVKHNNDFKPYYRSCIACWDNSARYDANTIRCMTAINFSLRDFYKMVTTNVREAEEMGKEFMFVFSWNEWCEGSYIEPDKKYGYAIINTLSKAIMGLPLEYGCDGV